MFIKIEEIEKRYFKSLVSRNKILLYLKENNARKTAVTFGRDKQTMMFVRDEKLEQLAVDFWKGLEVSGFKKKSYEFTHPRMSKKIEIQKGKINQLDKKGLIYESLTNAIPSGPRRTNHLWKSTGWYIQSKGVMPERWSLQLCVRDHIRVGFAQSEIIDELSDWDQNEVMDCINLEMRG